MAANNIQKVLVVKKFSNYYHVELSNKNIKFLCKSKKSLSNKSSVYVGDRVTINKIDFINNTAIITDILPRKNLLKKPQVANLSNVFLMFSLKQPNLNFDQINKFLLESEFSNLKINIILSKSDLVDDDFSQLMIKKFNDWGYVANIISLKNGTGLDAIKNILCSNNCSVITGPSGVGKTSLMNYLLPKLDLPTSPVSKKIKRGMHKTRNIQLFKINEHSFIVDTPGCSFFEIDIPFSQIQYLFPEIRIQRINIKCKFRNCLHVNEPGCKLNKNWERYEYYKKVLLSIISSGKSR